MIRPRTVVVGAATTALALGLSIGAATTAEASPLHAPAATSPTTTYTFAYNLLSPNSPVVLTVDGNYYATKTADSNGDVTFTVSTAGYETGRHIVRVVATDTGLWAQNDFGH